MPDLPVMEGICWNIEKDRLASSKSRPQPHWANLGSIWTQNKLDKSIVYSKKSLWLELQKAWDNFSIELLRKYIDTMPERCPVIAAKGGGHTKY